MGQLIKTVGLCGLELLPAISSSGSITGKAFSTKDISGDVLCVLSAQACSGGTTTLDVKLQGCATSGGSYADLSPAAAFTQVTTAASFQTLTINDSALPAFIKGVATNGAGTTAVYSMVMLSGKVSSTAPSPVGS